MSKTIIKSTILFSGLFFLTAMQCSAASSSSVSGGALAVLFGSMFGIIWLVVMGIMMMINILGVALWIWMIVDASKRKFKNENDKLMWILIIVLTGWIGAIIYYFIVKRKEDQK